MHDDDKTMFRVIYPRGIVSGYGTEFYVFGRKIPHISYINVSTSLDAVDNIVKTRIQIELVGCQLVTETFAEDR